MSAQPASIAAWRKLARVLADHAGELRAAWIGLNLGAAEADRRAQETICRMLVGWLPGRTSFRGSESGQDARLHGKSSPALTHALRRAGETLGRANRLAVLRDFEARHPGADPATHFYEHFLAEHDPARRSARGVFYTPRPVTRFIVQSVHERLQTQFGLEDGLAATDASGEIRILDPAAGTGAFLIEIIDFIHEFLHAKWSATGHSSTKALQLWNEYVARHLQRRLAGFELLPAACEMANLNIAAKLRATGYRDAGYRACVCTGDSLECLASGRAKKPGVLVVVGNPPYGSGARKMGARLKSLLADYKRGLNEINLNALSDDYVKFLRVTHALVARAGAGVVGMITNNSFLEGVTHRRMRELLLRDFNHVDVVDLHGSVMRRGEVPAGTNDQSVFDIQQGVAVTILARTPAEHERHVRRADLWGTRRQKFDRLAAGPRGMEWKELISTSPYYSFRCDHGLSTAEYANWPSLAEVFKVFSSGIKFRKDGLLVKSHFTRAGVKRMLRDVRNLPARELTTKYGFRETADWRLKHKRALFAHCGRGDIIEVLYRPFDVRYAFYPLDRAARIIVRGDSRVELMRHMLAKPNVGLLFNRQVVGEQVTHFLVSRRPVSHGTFYLGNKGQDYFAPLYLMNGRQARANLRPEFMARLRASMPKPAALAPEAVLHYLYAVVHSPAYRLRYAELLKTDFPHVPLPASQEVFSALRKLGANLLAIHLLEKYRIKNPPILAGKGAAIVAKGYPKRSQGRVYINADRWFDGLPEEVWNFQVGGYRVCEKWLKNRRGRKLSASDVIHYGRVAAALGQTARLMRQVDAVIEAHGGWPKAFAARQQAPAD